MTVKHTFFVHFLYKLMRKIILHIIIHKMLHYKQEIKSFSKFLYKVGAVKWERIRAISHSVNQCIHIHCKFLLQLWTE